MISFTDSFCAIQNRAITKLRLTFSTRRKIRLNANWLVWEERLWGVVGGSLWSNSRQFIGVTANTRAGEKVFKFLRLEFINCNLVRVTRVKISCLTKLAKLVIWTWQGGRSWQPFGEGKNGHKIFRQAHIYSFRDKCVVFARKRKFANLTQSNMQYI